MNPSPDASAPIVDRHAFRFLPTGTIVGLVVGVVTVVAFGLVSYRALSESAATADRLSRTQDVIERLQVLLSDLKDAETGQRGYLLTGRDDYLTPYTTARTTVPRDLDALRLLIVDNALQKKRLEAVTPLIDAKLDELQETIALRQAGNLAGALAIVQSDRGRVAMDRIRAGLGQIQSTENFLLSGREAEWQAAERASFIITLAGVAILLGLLAAATWLLARAYRDRETEAWMRAGQSGLAARMLGDRQIDALGQRIVAYLSRRLGAVVASIHADDGDGVMRALAGFGTAAGHDVESAPPGVRPPDAPGLVEQVLRDREPLVVRALPDGYLPVRSGVGSGSPRELLIVPAIAHDEVIAVLEFGFLRPVAPEDRELLGRVAPTIAIAFRAARAALRIQNLLEETQGQTEELQAQQEELRVNNEELEEQGRALKASQAQLEGQQAELEQTNSQLEEQAQILESQKDVLVESQRGLAEKAAELERSNQYKSEFLANMSHELRTPLNSTLILAKLLADNKNGNLTPEQVKFADTISSAGNDLLTLINDILDLSKIESGKVELDIADVTVARIVEPLVKVFEQTAKQKQLVLKATIEPGTAQQVETDAQRVGQILKNLLSNALKFTAKGEVALRVYAPAPDAIAFAVADSGIGIPEHQQDIIFEAFRQADGSTHRRYGGTGLGLSISRDLARLLGGDIAVSSTAGRGSVFTLTLPTRAAANAPSAEAARPAPTDMPAARPTPSSASPVPPPTAAAAANAAPGLAEVAADDRDKLSPTARAILVIEDDLRFAAILQELAHELGFQCIVTHSAGEGLAAATRYLPSAILLDMQLPDHSGLGVLDQLKQNPKTRHIPVHIASASDHQVAARALGAVGYDLKPVKREQLVEALEGLRERLAQKLRRVLVVEDDERQLDSIRELLQSEDVEIVGSANAADALARLRATTFDCMVMDLNLPDLSGYELLERMSQQEDVPFPPVIVYTGRMLTRDEEQRLRRYSKSIIIKDARSPERLLDEVTLFLHQVEEKLPAERQRMLREVRNRDASLEGRRILVVEDDVRNVFALTSVLEPKGATIDIARNGIEALERLALGARDPAKAIDLVLMDIMMPEMDGYTAMREIRKQPALKKLPIIALTAKAMRDDQEKCLAAGANDYVAKPLDVEKLLSLIRVWMPK